MMNIQLLIKYKAWANEKVFSAMGILATDELIKPRVSRFGNLIHTLNHVYVIDDIFKAHLLGANHGYSARNTESSPSLSELWQAQGNMDRWYMEFAARVSCKQLEEKLNFDFVDGGQGRMSRMEMLLHVVNHSTYHRGIIASLMDQIPHTLPATDLPVFLRELNEP